MSEDWPAAIRGVTESVVTTLGPNERWNVAALGLHAPDDDGAVTARTWGRTRTWRNLRERGEGYVQFTPDPVDFAEAACTVREEDEPVLDSALAWARVEATRLDDGSEGDTQWVDWALVPVDTGVVGRTVPTTNRGYYAVVEATIAASRFDVPEYDREALLNRLVYFADVVGTCGGPREREAFEVVAETVDADLPIGW